MHDSIIILHVLSFGTLFIHIRPLHSNHFVNIPVKIVFVQFGVCTAWWHLQELSQQSNSAQTQNLDEDSFDMLYKTDCWAAIPNPIWTTNVPYERKINMLSSTDKNFLIFLFDFEWFRIWISVSFFFNTHIVYDPQMEALKGKLSSGTEF